MSAAAPAKSSSPVSAPSSRLRGRRSALVSQATIISDVKTEPAAATKPAQVTIPKPATPKDEPAKNAQHAQAVPTVPIQDVFRVPQASANAVLSPTSNPQVIAAPVVAPEPQVRQTQQPLAQPFQDIVPARPPEGAKAVPVQPRQAAFLNRAPVPQARKVDVILTTRYVPPVQPAQVQPTQIVEATSAAEALTFQETPIQATTEADPATEATASSHQYIFEANLGVDQETAKPARSRRRSWFYVATATALFLLAMGGGVLWGVMNNRPVNAQSVNQSELAAPAENQPSEQTAQK